MLLNHLSQRSSTSNNDASFPKAAAPSVHASCADSRAEVLQGRHISWPASSGNCRSGGLGNIYHSDLQKGGLLALMRPVPKSSVANPWLYNVITLLVHSDRSQTVNLSFQASRYACWYSKTFNSLTGIGNYMYSRINLIKYPASDAGKFTEPRQGVREVVCA